MKLKVDQENCIGCGMCIDICPKLFKYNEDGKSETMSDEVAADLIDKALEAKDICPVGAIEEE